MNRQPKNKTYRIARRAGDQGARRTVSNQAGDVKHATGRNQRNQRMDLRKEYRIGTWNVRKLKEVGKLNTVCNEMKENNIQILGLSETNWNSRGSFKTTNNNTVLFAGKESGYSHGVGIILANEITNTIIGYNPVNDRIITVRIKAKPHNISIVQFYAPTSTATEEEIDDFYSQLQEVIDKIPNRDMKILMGDANAKVGKSTTKSETHGQFGLGVRNDRGNELIDFCKINNLVITNTCFQHHPRRLYTWISPDGETRNQIDYIMINKNWKACVKNVKTYPGADCNSDHQLLVAKCKVRLKKIQKPPPPLRFDTTLIDNEYTVEVENKFEELLRYEVEKSPNEIWETGKNIILEIAKEKIPKKKKTRFSWISNETLKEVEKRRTIKASGLTKPEDRAAYNEQNAVVQRMMRKDKQRAIDEQCKQLEDKSVTNSTKDLYNVVKNLTRKFKPATDAVKSEIGEMLTEGPQVKERWKTYCENLYKKSNIRPADQHAKVDQEDEPPPTYAEVEKAIRDLKADKSPGIDDLPAELLKKGGNNVIQYFHKICTAIWKQKEWPSDWRTSIFVILPKKGDTFECSNNRTIALISHSSKIILKIIANRMRNKLSAEIAEEQAGFRPGKGTRDQILNLKMILEKNREVGTDVYLCFIDYRKAFDTVVHEVLWNVMADMGFPIHITDLIRNLYISQKATIRTTHGMTDFFVIGQGVRQGCILSPHLFNIYAEQVMREALEHHPAGIKIGGRTINNLRYADDVVLIATCMQELQDLTNKVKAASEAAGLFLNVSKTKVMKVTQAPNDENLIVDNQNVENVEDFNYLGAVFTNKVDDTKEVRRRIAMAKTAMIALTNIWKDRSISQRTKKRLLLALVFSIATYGAECWVLKKVDKRKIAAFELWCYRRLLRVSWVDKRTNEWVLEKIGPCRRLLDNINDRKLRFLGHVARTDGLTKDLLFGTTPGKRGRGRPKTRMSDNVKDIADISMAELLRMAQNRSQWRRFVKSATAGQ